MPFEFISSAAAVARQHQLWGIVIGCVGLLILGYAMIKHKPLVMTLGGLALAAVGGYYLYLSGQLAGNSDQWAIRADSNTISWQSPDQALDPSFTLSLAEIDFIDRSAKQSRSDEGNVYHIVLKDGSAFALNDVSGIDLDQFAQAIASTGIEIKETGQYHLPQELRNK